MAYAVIVAAGAERDLLAPDAYRAHGASLAKADHVIGHRQPASENLAPYPENGTQPVPLVSLGIRDFRQVFFNPCRGIYRIAGKRVSVVVMAAACRDMQSPFARRLLGQ